MAEIDDHLEPFLLMAKSNKGAAAAKISRDATAAVSSISTSRMLHSFLRS
jgi:hypothetical protein